MKYEITKLFGNSLVNLNIFDVRSEMQLKSQTLKISNTWYQIYVKPIEQNNIRIFSDISLFQYDFLFSSNKCWNNPMKLN